MLIKRVRFVLLKMFKKVYLRRNKVSSNWLRERTLEMQLFDAKWYLRKYPEIAEYFEESNAFEHFIEYGITERRAPSEKFDPEWYWNSNSDLHVHNLNPITHYLKYGAAEKRLPLPPYIELTEIVREGVHTFRQCDPEFMANKHFQSHNISHLLRMDGNSNARHHKVLFELLYSLKTPFSYLVVVPWLTKGGADLVACNITKALVKKHGADSVLVLLADYDDLSARDWLPDGVSVRVLNSSEQDFSIQERVEILILFVLATRPKAVVNVNSHAMWQAIKDNGSALSNNTSLLATLFCRDYDQLGRPAGYADEYFRSCLNHLDLIYFDNQTFLNELVEEYGVLPEQIKKLAVLKQPIPLDDYKTKTAGPDLLKVAREEGLFSGVANNKVFWASRFCEQKNIKLLSRIVESTTSIFFDVYGYGASADQKFMVELAKVSRNVTLKGKFSSFEALPVSSYRAYLYTSLWDGIPTCLILAAYLRVPIVASSVGGISELVDDETGWLIKDVDNALAYQLALQEIIDNPALAQEKANKMFEKVKSLHSWGQFVATLEKSSFLLEA